MKNLEKAGMA